MSTADSTSATGVLASSDDRLPKEVKQVGVVVVLGTIMAILDTTIVAVALATLARDFHTSITTIQWVTTGYLLALAVVIPLSGWAVHRFGAKPVYIVSLALFITGSALCGLAWSAGVLVAFRVLQGLGGGMIMPVGQTIMARTAGPDLGPGDCHTSEAHTLGTNELVHVLEGTLTVEVADQVITLEAGDAASFPGDTPHSYANTARRPARFSLAVFDPGGSSPTREEVADV